MEEKTSHIKDDELSVHDLPLILEESIQNIARTAEFLAYEIFCKNISAISGSYMGIIYDIDIKGETAGGNRELNIFVKNIIENDQMKIFSVTDVFSREAFAYKELSRIFTVLQDEAGIPYYERFQMAKSYDESTPKSIILENLAKRGFKTYNRMDTVSIDYAKLCIQQLAKFHGLSMVIQQKRPEFFKKKVTTMKQPFVFEEDWHAFVKNMYNYSINCLTPEVKKKVENKILEKVDFYPKYLNDTTGTCTLCHGDYKHNNIMANEVNGEIKEVIPIDFQHLHYGCPVLDFLYFIFNGTDREFRKSHLSDLKDLYYATLEKFLGLFEIDIEETFSRMEFDRVYKEKLDFGLIINVFYVPFLFVSEGDEPDVTNQSLSALSFNVDSRFIKRFHGIVDDFVEWGYL